MRTYVIQQTGQQAEIAFDAVEDVVGVDDTTLDVLFKDGGELRFENVTSWWLQEFDVHE